LTVKACFKCNRVLPLAEFYRHKRMADGHIGKCKACARADTAAYAAANPEIVRAKKAAWAKTDAARALQRRVYQRRKMTNPAELRANMLVGNAIKLGKLIPQPCFVCGAIKAEAHHADYSLPLGVTWLCKKHHVETHQLAKQLKRKEVQCTN
jgi:hypothetical protein